MFCKYIGKILKLGGQKGGQITKTRRWRFYLINIQLFED